MILVVMLRNRSRVVTKQSPIMGDHQPSSNLSPNTQNPTRSISSFLSSPKFLFLSKIISPTSILDTNKQICNFANNPFRFTQNPEIPSNNFEKFKPKSENFNSQGIALALVLIQEKNSPNAQKLLFKSMLKIQIPSLDPFPNGSPESPGDFGIKTRNYQFSGAPTPTGFGLGSGSPKYTTGPLSFREMELSEEYTRVISHGSNPKTTHIYDNCVVDSCYGIRVGSPPLESFKSFCQTCNKNIGANSDIFMYRGDKAFCSEECRCQEMILDGLMN